MVMHDWGCVLIQVTLFKVIASLSYFLFLKRVFCKHHPACRNLVIGNAKACLRSKSLLRRIRFSIMTFIHF